MKSLELIIAIIALVISIIFLFSEVIFNKNEGKDERGNFIRGHSARASFSIVILALNLVVMLNFFFNFTLEIYKLLILGVIIISNIASFVTLQIYKRNY